MRPGTLWRPRMTYIATVPFTGAHPAAILPLTIPALRRVGLLSSGLVIGSMVPDVSLFTPLALPRVITHSLVGAFTVDAAIALVVTVVWVFAIMPVAYDLCPWVIRRRLPTPRFRLQVKQWLWLYPSVVLGALSHVVWDSFTHVDGQMVLMYQALTNDVWNRPIYKWGQYVSGFVGMAAIALWVAVLLVLAHPRPSVSLTTGVERVAMWSTLTLIPFVSGVARAGLTIKSTANWLYNFLTMGMAVGVVMVVLVTVWWWVGLHRFRALVSRLPID